MLKYAFLKIEKMLHPKNPMSHYTPTPITATSLQRSLSSVPKVIVVERFNCIVLPKQNQVLRLPVRSVCTNDPGIIQSK